MSQKVIAVVTISLFYLFGSPAVRGSGLVVPPAGGDRSLGRASGSRGCPVELGELEIVADDPAYLKSTRERPSLIYRVRPATPSGDFLIVVSDREGKVVLDKRIHLSGGDEVTIALRPSRPLEIGRTYTVTAGLLCDGRRDRATVLNSLLIRLPGTDSTAFDNLGDRYREGVSRSVN